MEPLLREVKIEDAIGTVLAHDLTQILPGEFKGRKFRKGHVITEEDIPVLLSIGKEHIYVMNLTDDYVHEEDAAVRIASALAGDRTYMTEPHEGKVTIKSSIHGLAKVDKDLIDTINRIEDVSVATIRTDTVVTAGQSIAGCRVTPLFVKNDVVRAVEETITASGLTMTIKPFLPLKVGIVTTGSEIYKGRITDKFGPAVTAKVEALGGTVLSQRIANDDKQMIGDHILAFISEGADLVLATGGMSVDPDDRTPGAIRDIATEVVRYGTPMLPGSMLMAAYVNGVPVLGLPGCVMHDPFTSFDVLLPKVMAGEKITSDDITTLGYGGLQ